ncbi:MAG TPA: heme ABC transporter ATP-binding protein [Anaerolineales bacterium]
MAELELLNVSLGYTEHPILRQVSLRVDPGEILAVVGPNGVGKSTLIKAASGALPPLSGEVRINGQDLRSLRPAARARLVSVVPQATDLPGSFLALDVVLMGRTPYLRWLENEGALDKEAAQRAMQRTELAELAERPVGELSGGEQQRVLIARALAQQAPVMLLDEPTAHLDLRHQDQVLRLVRELARERSLAVLLALHDLNLVARFADRVALLSNGEVGALGKPEQVLTPDGLAEVYGMRIHVMPHPVFGTPLVLSGE